MQRDKTDLQLSDADLELLSQYLDGELPPQDSRLLEARLGGDAQLQSALVKLKELNQRLHDVLAEHDSVPAEVSALLEQQDDAVHAAGNRSGAKVLKFPTTSPAVPGRQAPRWQYALAASLVGAVALSLFGDFGSEPRSSLPGNDALVSAALDELPSGEGWASLQDGREVQPVLSFPHQDGRWCREYLLREQSADWRAVACREGGSWVTQAAGLESYLEAGDAYRPAGVDDAAPVAGFITRHAADIALGRTEEADIIARSWEQ